MKAVAGEWEKDSRRHTARMRLLIELIDRFFAVVSFHSSTHSCVGSSQKGPLEPEPSWENRESSASVAGTRNE